MAARGSKRFSKQSSNLHFS